MLSEKGQIALDAVCCQLRTDPESYEQGEWGAGNEPDCDTPACVAGHIVATMKSAKAGYRRRLDELGGTATKTERDDAIRDAATETLGLKETPRLFEPQWPREWLERAGGTPEHPLIRKIEPSADEAMMVLETIMDGELDEALEPSTILHERTDEVGFSAEVERRFRRKWNIDSGKWNIDSGRSGTSGSGVVNARR